MFKFRPNERLTQASCKIHGPQRLPGYVHVSSIELYFRESCNNIRFTVQYLFTREGFPSFRQGVQTGSEAPPAFLIVVNPVGASCPPPPP
jgi:hypothetical protein